MAGTLGGASAAKRRALKVDRKPEKVGGKETACCCSDEVKGQGGVANLAMPSRIPTRHCFPQCIKKPFNEVIPVQVNEETNCKIAFTSKVDQV